MLLSRSTAGHVEERASIPSSIARVAGMDRRAPQTSRREGAVYKDDAPDTLIALVALMALRTATATARQTEVVGAASVVGYLVQPVVLEEDRDPAECAAVCRRQADTTHVGRLVGREEERGVCVVAQARWSVELER